MSCINEKNVLFIETYNIFAHIGNTTVHFSKDRLGANECRIYLDKNGRNPSIQYIDRHGKSHRKSMRILIQELEDTSDFPETFAVPVRRRKSQRHVGDRGANHTVYKTVSLNKMLTV